MVVSIQLLSTLGVCSVRILQVARSSLIGALGLLLAARLKGSIKPLREEIEKLEDAGFHAAPVLVERLRREAREA